MLKSVTKDEARVVARVTWDPLVEPAALLDGAMLARNVGQKVKVVVDGRWLGEGVDVGDPARFEPVPTSPVSDRQGANASLAREGEKMAKRGASLADWTAWDLEPLRKRKVWGSEVYTDDSDVLAMCLHTGWVRYRHEGALSGSVTPKAIEVTLQVAPRLVRYQGSLRGGIKSRSWGNGHDGVSLIVVEVKPLLVRSLSRTEGSHSHRRTVLRGQAFESSSR